MNNQLQQWGRQLAPIAFTAGAVNVARRVGEITARAARYMERERKRQRPNSGKKKVIQDSRGGYNQFSRYKFRSGRRRTTGDKRQSILNTIISNYRLRISRIADLSSGQGAYFLGHGLRDANRDYLPVLACNLSSVRQGNFNAKPMRRLCIFKNTPFDGAMDWQTVDSTGSSGIGPNPDWQFEDNEGVATAVGRKSFFDWVRIKLTLWGKQNAPAQVRVMLVKFTDEEYVPHTYPDDTGMSDNANAFWASLVKPLITNPTASINMFPKRAMRVLKSYNVNFDPISTTEADQDPHCKCLDIFHRVGKQMDYTKANYGVAGNATVVTNEQLNDADAYVGNDSITGATRSNFGEYPRHIEDSLYLIITSMAQDRYTTDGGFSKQNEVSIDWNIQVCHKTVQPT